MFASTDWKSMLFRPQVAQGICLAFVLLIVLQCIFFSMALRATKQSNFITAIDVPLSSKPIHDESKLNQPLFGDYLPKQFGDVQIKNSTLDLKVVGILFSKHPKESEVIIHTASGTEKSFKIGDTIVDDVVIKRISANEILIMHHGQLESLSLPKNSLTFEPPPKGLFSKE